MTAMKLPRARAILFDLDGTLVDSRKDIAAACNHALAAVGRPPLDEATIAGFVGDGARMLLSRALQTGAGAEPILDEALARFQAFYARHAADHTTWMPGALDALEALTDRALALVTNKPREATLAVLEALGQGARFGAIVAGGDGPLKPDPRAVHAALGPLHVLPAEAWMVGDGRQDIEAGRAAGCSTVAVRGGFGTAEQLAAARPDCTLDSLVGLVALVRASDA